MSPGDHINAALDALPRARLGRGDRERPTFRSLGVAGFYAAFALTFGAALARGLSPLVTAGVAAASGVSFFAYAHLRRALTGRERLVLLEHVWVALSCVTALLLALEVPILPYLDAMTVGLAVFLVFGRLGCLCVGCCHGRPARLGIRYQDAGLLRDGFSIELAGVRLFPVQLIEAAGLFAIAITSGAVLALAPPGTALAWFLIAYAVLRFALEGLRGDARPHLLGLSQARWMAAAQAVFAALLVERTQHRMSLERAALVGGALALTLLVGAAVRHLASLERRLLGARHRRELAERLDEPRGALDNDADVVDVERTSLGVSIALSPANDPRAAHLSLSMREGPRDLRLLAELAAAAAGDLGLRSARASDGPTLHVLLPLHPGKTGDRPAASAAVYGAAVRAAQEAVSDAPAPPAVPTEAPTGARTRRTYFGGAAT
jgi:hypothetical protein